MGDVITYWNRGAEELYGWTAEEAIGRNAHELLQAALPSPLEVVRAELLSTGRWEGEIQKTRADGTGLAVASRWSLRRDEQGRPVAILETNNDISQRKRREQEVRALNDELAQRTVQLEATNKELEAFAYSVSHDLRAPLRHMAGFTELLQRHVASQLDEKSQRYVTMILESAKRMGSLIDDLLAFSRIGRAEAHRTTFSLQQVVQEALAEVKPEIEAREIAWTIGTLPTWHGDRSMVRLALANLISNAVKFTRTRPRAEIEIACARQDHEQVVLVVRDNGVGFDMRYVNKLFGVFQRLHAPEAFEGTGIGLATVQRIAHRHGGKAWAESVVDRGATFYLSLSKSGGA
jgi:PAS domain S-box-containing protein